MTGAMYAAISGLKSHMNKLNVIGNNIANVNTYGYKTSRMTFRESMYTTLTAGRIIYKTTTGNQAVINIPINCTSFTIRISNRIILKSTINN